MDHEKGVWRPPLWAWGFYAGAIALLCAGVAIAFHGFLWLGVSVVVLAFVLCSIATAALSGLVLPRRDVRCHNCGYDLDGLPNAIKCPECGQALP
jgi:hypothetical protein